MLMIIAHHYVVNSGLTEVWSANDEIGNSLFLALFGWGGKTGINCFILITGYFMCQKNFSWQKLCKLLFEVQFYATTIYLIFLIGGRPFSWGELKDMVLWIPLGVGHGFVGSFIVLYLLIPFVNQLVKAMTKCEFQYLLVLWSLFCRRNFRTFRFLRIYRVVCHYLPRWSIYTIVWHTTDTEPTQGSIVYVS
jgi:brp/blh family beta-carotene 15,15'-monooxygenase